jgi:hypothetical protein
MHFDGFKKSGVGGILKHCERQKKTVRLENGETVETYYKFRNQNIDETRTPLNYNLAPVRDESSIAYTNRLAKSYALNRDDVNVLCSWIVTLPEKIPAHSEQKFFQDTYDFLVNRYGFKGTDENIISAAVHKDEETPHMHFAFVPMVEKLTKRRGLQTRISAKDVMPVAGRYSGKNSEVKQCQLDLEKHLEQKFGYKVGILNGETILPGSNVYQLKAYTEAQKDLLDSLSKLNPTNAPRAQFLTKWEQRETELELMPVKFEAKKLPNTRILSKDNFEQMTNLIISLQEKLKASSASQKAMQKHIETNMYISPNDFEQLRDALGKAKLPNYLIDNEYKKHVRTVESVKLAHQDAHSQDVQTIKTLRASSSKDSAKIKEQNELIVHLRKIINHWEPILLMQLKNGKTVYDHFLDLLQKQDAERERRRQAADEAREQEHIHYQQSTYNQDQGYAL